MPDRAAPRPVGHLTALLALLLYLALRWPGMTQSLWLDEVFRTRVGLSGDSARFLILYDVHNPLYNLFMFAWIRVVGDSEIAVRLPSLLAGAVLIAALYRWTLSRFGSVVASLTAAWLIASPVHAWYSTEAKNNIFTVLFTTLAVMGLERAMRTRTARAVAWAALASFAAVATDFQSLLVLLPAWAVSAWLALRRAPAGGLSWGDSTPGVIARVGPLVLCLFAAGLFAVPWIIFKSGHAEGLTRQYVGYFHWHEALRLLLVWFPTGSAIPPLLGEPEEWWLWRGLLLAPLIAPLFFLGSRSLARTPAGLLVLAGVLWPLLIMLAANEALVLSGSSARLYQPRNLLVMLPWVAVVIAAGAHGLALRSLSLRLRPAILAAPILLALVSTILIRTSQADRTTVITPNPDWRGVGAWIRSQDAHTPLPVICNALLSPIRYYAPGRDAAPIARRSPTLDEVRAAADAHAWREFIFVANTHWWPPPTPADYAALTDHYELIARAEFRSLVALRLRQRP
jgi:uncharacterized membrane protein